MLSRNTQDLDYGRLVRAARKLETDPGHTKRRIALLGDAATQFFVPLLRTLFYENGVTGEIYEGNFDALDLEILNPVSALYRFKPDVVILLNCTQSLRAKYYARAGSGESFATDTVHHMIDAWDIIHRHSPASVIQCNFAAPEERFFGNYDQSVGGALSSVIQTLNQSLAAEARTRRHVFIADIAHLAASVGTRNWYDERHWLASKMFCAPDCLPLAAQNFVEMALIAIGRVVKCLVLDLDNTLWGGVVGDDGPEGIEIGAHGDGESFYNFQCYLRELKRRGLILAVCSKNDHAVAIRPFRENPEMALREEDVAVFAINWDNKADNIRTIRDILDIGLDSMVFLDDNPFERNLVREFVPEVIVPELPEDPADYVRYLSALNLFEANSFSAEDAARVDQYRQEAARRATASEFTNIGDYLKSLQMRIQVERFDAFHLSRIVQLIQRSNQFNLTTQRHNQAQCEDMMEDHDGCIPWYARLSDKFGDHGLISIVIMRPEGETLRVTDWLMSCRVLGRGVEQYLMNRVFVEAQSHKCIRVTGKYLPTAKNALVRDFFEQFGFQKTASGEDGQTEWALDVSQYEPRTVFIESTPLVMVA
ncbi:MAG: HAD-IIIC family phosphatase [Bryobacteraceae bacterium]